MTSLLACRRSVDIFDVTLFLQDVRNIVGELCRDHGGLSEGEAEEFVKKLESQKRYSAGMAGTHIHIISREIGYQSEPDATNICYRFLKILRISIEE